MEIKVVKPINFLYFRAETKLSELVQFLPVAQELYEEAVRRKINVTGAVHWHYFGFEGDPTKSFQLEVALPVADVIEDYDGKFHFKRTQPYKCVSIFHTGSWMEIPSSYAKAGQFMAENKLVPISANREIYINSDFKDPSANFTEIQIGVK